MLLRERLKRVVAREVDGDERSQGGDGRTQTLVEGSDPALGIKTRERVVDAPQLRLNSQSCPDDVEWMSHDGGTDAGHSSACEALNNGRLLASGHAADHGLAVIESDELRGRVGEDADTVRKVATPVTLDSILSRNPHQRLPQPAILVRSSTGGEVLRLHQNLHTVEWCSDRARSASSSTAGNERVKFQAPPVAGRLGWRCIGVYRLCHRKG
mmetsp:Transcript_45380/g.106560  ORF Transcript_45380/g.106560 Transcript_45380/m.106560 type:complete len:212 (+) Transcript_45380:563-1198(+)